MTHDITATTGVRTVRAAEAHRETHVSRFQCRPVVGPVPCHSDYFAHTTCSSAVECSVGRKEDTVRLGVERKGRKEGRRERGRVQGREGTMGVRGMGGREGWREAILHIVVQRNTVQEGAASEKSTFEDKRHDTTEHNMAEHTTSYYLTQ